MISFIKLIITVIKLWIDDLIFFILRHSEAELFNSVGNNIGTTNKGRMSHSFIKCGLHSTKDVFIFPFRINNAFWIYFRIFKNWLHQHIRFENKITDFFFISIHIFNRARRNTTIHCRLRHCGRHFKNKTWIKRFWNNIFRTEF